MRALKSHDTWNVASLHEEQDFTLLFVEMETAGWGWWSPCWTEQTALGDNLEKKAIALSVSFSHFFLTGKQMLWQVTFDHADGHPI